jgi:hypothetical protein
MQLDDGRVLAFWRGEDDQFRLQTIDASRGTALGPALALGVVNTSQEEDYELQALRALALPEGDLAIFGALRDGRITYLRGSRVAERRVAARVVRAADDRVVSSFSVASTSEGFALFVLKIQESQRRYYSAERGELELHALDARGEALRPARSWRGAGMADARAAQCGDQLYLARRSRDSVFVRALATSTQKLSPDRRLGLIGVEDLSPLYCQGSAATLLAAWGTENGGSVPQIGVTTLGASAKRTDAWNKVALPGAPFALENAVVVGSEIRRVPIDLLGAHGSSRVTLELPSATVSPSDFPTGTRGECLALRDGAHVLCGSAEQAPRADGCPTSASVSFSLYGAASATSARDVAPLASAFFAPGDIARPSDPGAGDLANRNERLWCGEPGFSELRSALRNWCKLHAKQDEARRICGKEPEQLLAQVSACSDLPPHCDQTRASKPSVLRASFDAGEPVLLRHGSCTVHFTRAPPTWQVEKVECSEGC